MQSLNQLMGSELQNVTTKFEDRENCLAQSRVVSLRLLLPDCHVISNSSIWQDETPSLGLNETHHFQKAPSFALD
jgi:hypothetical protein